MKRGLLADRADLRRALGATDLTSLIELGPTVWSELRTQLTDGLATGAIDVDADGESLTACELSLPCGSSITSTSTPRVSTPRTWARMLRPDRPQLPDSWLALPVGYHGRSSTVVVSGTPIRRPWGQVTAGAYGPTGQLDLECELGFVCGPGAQGPVDVDRAQEHVFGVVLVNDWSARDIQRVEASPLGPHQGKSFATSMSAWITPLGRGGGRARTGAGTGSAAAGAPARARAVGPGRRPGDRVQRTGDLAPERGLAVLDACADARADDGRTARGCRPGTCSRAARSAARGRAPRAHWPRSPAASGGWPTATRSRCAAARRVSRWARCAAGSWPARADRDLGSGGWPA